MASLASPSDATAGSYTPFDGEKTSWHDGFDRYDFVMDEATLAMRPFKRDEDERYGVKAPAKGERRCIVVVPKESAAGNPWSWQGCYWNHEPQTEQSKDDSETPDDVPVRAVIAPQSPAGRWLVLHVPHVVNSTPSAE